MTLFEQEYAVERYGDEKKPREELKEKQKAELKDEQRES